MKKHLLVSVCAAVLISKSYSQNLISNSSFTKVSQKKDSADFYKILPEPNSMVGDWYLPKYLYRSAKKRTLYETHIWYHSRRDRELSFTNQNYIESVGSLITSEQICEENLGFLSLWLDWENVTVAQQALQEPPDKGQYCLKFKYKFDPGVAPGNDITLDFSISKTDLKEYSSITNFSVPNHEIQVKFKDVSGKSAYFNNPWLQKCFSINLKGNEKYITVGTLSQKNSVGVAHYLIDDIELSPQKKGEPCSCDIFNPDLKGFSTRNFIEDKEIFSDSLTVVLHHFVSENYAWTTDMVCPETQVYLKQIISFMQRNENVEIVFTYYDPWSGGDPSSKAPQYDRYLELFSINKSRIHSQTKYDTQNRIDDNETHINVSFIFRQP